jgi:copper oxidase (laccase) domain-containing protein
VAAVHAGWRGIVAGVIPAAVATLRAEAAFPPELIAAIGPHISSRAFEVSSEVAGEIAEACGDASVVDHARGPKPYVDLRRAARLQLGRAGLLDRDIDDVPGCTLSDSARFFSFRRDGQHSGRHLSAITPRPP